MPRWGLGVGAVALFACGGAGLTARDAGLVDPPVISQDAGPVTVRPDAGPPPIPDAGPPPTRDAGPPPRPDAGPPPQPDAGPPPVTPASPVAAENALPGTSAWAITRAASQGRLEGYAGDVSFNHGDAIDIHLSADAPTDVRWELYRMGWYGGKRGRLIATGGPLTVVHQPPPPANPVTGLVECAWPVSFMLQTDGSWVSGIYMLKLIRADGLQRYLPIVIRADERKNAAVVQASVTTWQAYNDWGDESLYSDSLGLNGGHAREVSFDRPYTDGYGAGEFFYFEDELVQWIESHGYDATYLTNVDVHRDPSLLAGQKLFISSGHDEYWSRGEKDAVEAAIAGGASAAFFTADAVFWQIRLEPSRGQGRPYRTEVCYKESAQQEDPLRGTNLITKRWRDPAVAEPEQKLLGVMSDGWEFADLPWIVRGSSSWVYEGTGVRDGDSIPLLVGYESDRIFPDAPSPTGVQSLAESPVASFDSGAPGPSWHNATVYTTPSGGFVFAAGIVQWAYGLAGKDVADVRVQRMTSNLFRRAGLSPRLPGDTFGATSAPQVDETRAASSVSTLAGVSGAEGFVDGPGSQARFRRPVGIAADASGNLYVADAGNHAIRTIANDANHTVTTIAGTGSPGLATGPGLQAGFKLPYAIAVGPAGELYVADFGSNRIVRIDTDAARTVSVWAGSPNGYSGNLDGIGTAARFTMPSGIAAVGSDLYVVDAVPTRLFRIDAAQTVVTVIAGAGYLNGPAATAMIRRPTGIAAGADALYVVDTGNRSIRRVALDAIHSVSTVAGNGYSAGFADGPAANARLMPLFGVAVRGTDVLFADPGSARIRVIGNGEVATIAGSGRSAGDDGPALDAAFNLPAGIAALPDGTIAVVDHGDSTIRLIRP